ncbi:MAG: gamma-glutamylcyclotransferase family protein [Pseudomonadota bacterium]
MTTEALVGYFGYGSLVNRQTLKTRYAHAIPVRLKGWRRHWQSRASGYLHYTGKDIALLSVHESQDTNLSGMLILDQRENLDEIDIREKGYDRHRLDPNQLDFGADVGQIMLPRDLFIYVGKSDPDDRQNSKLLQSYLDTVLAGYLSEYGSAGIEHLLETTVGFERDIIADRENPIYTRAIRPDDELAMRFDALLQAKGARLI